MKRIHETRGRKPVIHADRLPELTMLWRSGWSQMDIARHFGCSRGAIRNAIERTEYEWAEAAE